MQLELKTLSYLKRKLPLAFAFFACSALAQQPSRPAQTEEAPLGRRPVLSQVRGSETEFLKWFETMAQGIVHFAADVGSQKPLEDSLKEAVERFLYESRDPSFIKINPTDLPDQVAWKLAIKKIVPRISRCRTIGQGPEALDFYVVQVTDLHAAIKAENFDIFSGVTRYRPTDIERRNGAIPSSSYTIRVGFGPHRGYVLTNSAWTPWREKYDGGEIHIKIREVAVPKDKSSQLLPFVIDVENTLNFEKFDCALLPNEPRPENAVSLEDRVKHLEPEEQVSLLTELSKSHDQEAMKLLAEHYRTGTGVGKNFPKVVELWEELAATDPTVFKNLAVCFWKGELGPRDPAKTARYLEQAVNGGDTSATCDYAICLKGGIGRSVDSARAAVYFAKAAEAGNGRAQHILGMAQVEQNPQNLDEAVRLLSLATKSEPWAEYPLGLAYAYLLKERCPATWHFLTSNRDAWQAIPAELTSPIFQSMSEHFTKAVQMKDGRAYPYFAFLVTPNHGAATTYAYAASKMSFDGRLVFDENTSSIGRIPWFSRDSRILIDGDQLVKEAKPAPNLFRLSFDDSDSERNAGIDSCPKNLVLTTSQIAQKDERAPVRVLDPKYWGGGQDPNQSPSQPSRRRGFSFHFP